MKKLADISQFESLYNASDSGMSTQDILNLMLKAVQKAKTGQFPGKELADMNAGAVKEFGQELSRAGRAFFDVLLRKGK